MQNDWYSWYRSFDENHGAQARQQWYSDSARAYRWARPTYPTALIDRVVAQSQLKASASILEIGCGPGIATAAFAQRGFRICGVEPSAAACEMARQACEGYGDRLTLHNSTFENYPLSSQPFDAVLAATSFHWISPEIACKKSAAALNPNGSLILLWATPPQPSEEICEYLSPIYERYDLAELGQERRRTQDDYQNNFEMFAKAVNESGYFQPTSVGIQQQQSIYSIEKYLALLSTLSPYIALEAQRRGDLFDAIAQQLAAKLETGALTTTHWFADQVSSLSR
ncbi:MAG: class I SAM-dependent methyltransferase [Phormidesmis sp.]